jgi:hypothetical protein
VTNKKLPIGTVIALAATGLFLTILTSSTIISGAVLSSQSINSGGSITSMNVEIFSDNDYTQTCNNINWGTIAPGDSISHTIYIKNSGNKPITLSMTTDNWNPINASNYMDLIWDKENVILNPGQVTSASLTLITSSDTSSITDFDFNIIIVGAE